MPQSSGREEGAPMRMHEVRVLRGKVPSQKAFLQRLHVSVVQKYIDLIDISQVSYLNEQSSFAVEQNLGGAIKHFHSESCYSSEFTRSDSAEYFNPGFNDQND